MSRLNCQFYVFMLPLYWVPIQSWSCGVTVVICVLSSFAVISLRERGLVSLLIMFMLEYVCDLLCDHFFLQAMKLSKLSLYMFVCFDALRPSQHFSVMSGGGLSGLNQS